MTEYQVPTAIAQRIIIRFLVLEGVRNTEIFRRLQNQFGTECLSRAAMFKWAKAFKDGRETVENEPHARRPRTSITQLILEDRRRNVRDISADLGISIGSVESIIHEHLQYRSKRRTIPARSAILLQDNARPHTARLTLDTISKLGWEVLEHPPYSPDLSPCDYHMFGPLKEALGGQRFNTDDEVEEVVCTWLSELPQGILLYRQQKASDKVDKMRN